MNKRYLLVKASGGGGLGDCIKSVLVAAKYAALSNRILVVDWAGGLYSAEGENPFYEFFAIRGLPAQKAIPLSEDVFPPRWRGRLKKSLHAAYTEDGWVSWDRARTIEQYSADLSNINYPQEVLVVWDFDQLGKLGGPVDIASYRLLRERYLTLSTVMSRWIAQERQKLGDLDLGIHIRASEEFYLNKGKTSLQSYITKITALRKQHQSINSLYLATDNIDVLQRVNGKFPTAKYIDKWLGGAGDSLHLNAANPSPKESLKSAILDILILSKCEHILITPGSSFSEMAQIFASAKQLTHIPHQSLVSRLKNSIVRAVK